MNIQELVMREKRKLRKPMAVQLRRRHRLLQSITGTYRTNYFDPARCRLALAIHPDIATKLTAAYGGDIDYQMVASNRLPNEERLAKWLLKQGVSQNAVDSFTHLARTDTDITFEVTVRYKDLLRIYDTKHYKSCLYAWRGIQILRYLGDPCVGLIVRRDTKGDFEARMLARLLLDPNGVVVLGVNRLYGNNLPMGAIARALSGKIKVYRLGRGDRLTPLRTIDTPANPNRYNVVCEDSPHDDMVVTAPNGSEMIVGMVFAGELVDPGEGSHG